MKKNKKKPKARRAVVSSGQFYRVPRAGKPARHVRVTRVRGLRGHQPVAYYVEVTRTFKSKPGDTIRRFLQWDGKGWGMGPGFEICVMPSSK